MNLSYLSDTALLSELKQISIREKKVTTKALWHFKEVESRRLFVELGYSSLFSYAVKELGYSESAALRRIQASRMLFETPELGKKIENGILSLANVAQASKFFNENNVSAKEEKKKVLKKLENKSRSEGEKTLFELSGKKAPKIESIRRNSAASHEVRFTVSEETLQKFEELKGLLAHRRKTRLEDIFDFAVALAIEELKRVKFKQAPSRKRASKAKTNTRYIPSGVKRAVYEKAGGKCSNCGGRYKLEYDHIKPFAFGGETSEKNLRLLCFSCNQRQRIKAGLLRAGCG